MQYFPIQKRWRRLRPIYEHDAVTATWYDDLCAYLCQKAEEYGFKPSYPKLTSELKPKDFDSVDWRSNRTKRGRRPAYWDYVVHSACHWVVSMHLHVAKIAYPKIPWRIVTSDKHSTVWDGDETLWDGNFMALGISADNAWELAAKQPDSEIWAPGKMMLHEVPEDVLY